MFVMRSKVGHFRGVDGLFGLLPQISIMVAAAITRMGSFASSDDQYIQMARSTHSGRVGTELCLRNSWMARSAFSQ